MVLLMMKAGDGRGQELEPVAAIVQRRAVREHGQWRRRAEAAADAAARQRQRQAIHPRASKPANKSEGGRVEGNKTESSLKFGVRM